MAITLRDMAIAGLAFEAGKHGDTLEVMKAKLAEADQSGLISEPVLSQIFNPDGTPRK